MRHNLSLLIAAFGSVITASTAFAQTNTASDVTGVSTTGSTIAGGAFSPSPGTVSTPVTAAVQAAVVATTQAITSQITNTSLTTVTGAIISPAVQAQVGAVLLATSSVTAAGAISSPAATGLAGSLTSAGAPAAAVHALVESLAGLISNPAPGQLTAAVSNYNQVVESASVAFLANPPAQFLAVQAVLAQLSTAGGGKK